MSGAATAGSAASSALGAAVLTSSGYANHDTGDSAACAAVGNSVIFGGMYFLLVSSLKVAAYLEYDVEFDVSPMRYFMAIKPMDTLGNVICTMPGYAILSLYHDLDTDLGAVVADAAVGSSIIAGVLSCLYATKKDCCPDRFNLAQILPLPAAQPNNAAAEDAIFAADEVQAQQIVAQPREDKAFELACNQFTRDYIESMEKIRGLDTRIEELELDEKEQKQFARFRDPITETYIKIPLILNDRFYDLQTLKQLNRNGDYVDPFTNIVFQPNEIQSGRMLLVAFEKLLERRNKEREGKVVEVEAEANDKGIEISMSRRASSVSLFASPRSRAASPSARAEGEPLPAYEVAIGIEAPGGPRESF
jgi:hypothetical protein